METKPSNWSQWRWIAIYAMAMAWVESAVVFYLRSMIDRIDPHQPNPLPMIGGFALVELVREFATLVMLMAVGVLAGRTWRARLGYTVMAFGVWDIFYYVFLKLICGWPNSLMDWDILFLLPMPWWGPVLSPVLISLLMILWGTAASQFEDIHAGTRPNRIIWLANFAGVVLALYVFMADAIAVLPQGVRAVRQVLPQHFNWPLFMVALGLMSAPLLRTGRRACLHFGRKMLISRDPLNE